MTAMTDEERHQRKLASAQRYREKHKEQRREAQARYKREHPDLVAERQRQAQARYRERHKSDPEYQERVRAADRARWPKRKADPHQRGAQRVRDQRFKAKHRDDPEYRRKNRERQLAYQKTEQGKTVINAISRLRYSREQQAEGSFTAQEWLDLLTRYDHRCLCCGQRFQAGLVPDHIVPLSRGGTDWISNIQPLCKICNCEKAPGRLIIVRGKEAAMAVGANTHNDVGIRRMITSVSPAQYRCFEPNGTQTYNVITSHGYDHGGNHYAKGATNRLRRRWCHHLFRLREDGARFQPRRNRSVKLSEEPCTAN